MKHKYGTGYWWKNADLKGIKNVIWFHENLKDNNFNVFFISLSEILKYVIFLWE